MAFFGHTVIFQKKSTWNRNKMWVWEGAHLLHFAKPHIKHCLWIPSMIKNFLPTKFIRVWCATITRSWHCFLSVTRVELCVSNEVPRRWCPCLGRIDEVETDGAWQWSNCFYTRIYCSPCASRTLRKTFAIVFSPFIFVVSRLEHKLRAFQTEYSSAVLDYPKITQYWDFDRLNIFFPTKFMLLLSVTQNVRNGVFPFIFVESLLEIELRAFQSTRWHWTIPRYMNIKTYDIRFVTPFASSLFL